MMADNEAFRLSETPLSPCTTVDCIAIEHLKVFKTIVSDSGAKGLSLPEKYTDKDGNELTFDWNNKYVFVTPDGYVYGLDVDMFLNEKVYHIYADVNSAKKPNTEKKDLVLFTISDIGKVTEADIQNKKCSWDDLSACKTSEQCYALEPHLIGYKHWEGGCANGWYDWGELISYPDWNSQKGCTSVVMIGNQGCD